MGEEEGKRRARLRLTPPLLAALLEMPPGTVVVAAQANNDPLSIDLIVEHPDIPASPLEAESPYAYLHHTVTEYTTPDGEVRREMKTSVQWPESGGWI